MREVAVEKAGSGRSAVDYASIGGLLLAVAGIAGGMLLDGGSIGQVAQPTALLIVLGGTVGAVMVQFPMAVFLEAWRQAGRVLVSRGDDGEGTVAQLVAFAVRARRLGLLSLDVEIVELEDSFLKRAMMLAIDTTDAAAVRGMLELEVENEAEREDAVPQVFEAAGGFAPTVGIIGAVMGLIQVMQHLGNIDRVGRGIASAFVATIYGVGLANLVCLPAAGKLKFRNQEAQTHRMMVIEGVISIVEGINPRMLEMRLRTFLSGAKATSEAKVRVPA